MPLVNKTFIFSPVRFESKESAKGGYDVVAIYQEPSQGLSMTLNFKLPNNVLSLSNFNLVMKVPEGELKKNERTFTFRSIGISSVQQPTKDFRNMINMNDAQYKLTFPLTFVSLYQVVSISSLIVRTEVPE